MKDMEVEIEQHYKKSTECNNADAKAIEVSKIDKIQKNMLNVLL